MVVVGGIGSMPGRGDRRADCRSHAGISALVRRIAADFFGALVVVLMGFSRGGIAGLASVLCRRLVARLRRLKKPAAG